MKRGKSVEWIDPTSTTLKNGEFYAFDLEGRKFFATVHNHTSGFLELTEIPDPYICKKCGRGYQEGNHHFVSGSHEYAMRGAP